MVKRSKCNFCGKDAQLQLSHIIPKFVSRWAKETSPGFLRNTKNPNVRAQDGEKYHLLCSDCENLFGKWEKDFSETIFIPLHNSCGGPLALKYRDWCLKFCVSVSWRVLLYHKIIGLTHLSNEQIEIANKAFEVWDDFLKGKRSHPERFEQHILPLDIIKSHNAPNLSPGINRYFLRAIDCDVIRSKTIVMTYAKMCRIALFGFIKFDEKDKWKGTKVYVKEGSIGEKDYCITDNIFNFLSARSNSVLEAMQNISQNQSDKIEESILKNIDRVKKSDFLKAMAQDVALFGDEAFGKK